MLKHLSRISIRLAMADGRASSSSSGSPVFFLCSRAKSSPAKSSPSGASESGEAPSEDNSSIGTSFLPDTKAGLEDSSQLYVGDKNLKNLRKSCKEKRNTFRVCGVKLSELKFIHNGLTWPLQA